MGSTMVIGKIPLITVVIIGGCCERFCKTLAVDEPFLGDLFDLGNSTYL
jgi:hypothetical protein